MAFTPTTPDIVFLGSGAVVARGTYVNDGGSTGGDIPTGLSMIKGVVLSNAGAAVTNAQVYNETLPLGSWTAVTVVTAANASGTYEIYGEL